MIAFDWDPTKAAANIANHKVSFEQAKGVFRDPFAVEFEDNRENYSEERYIIIGMTEGRLLTVVGVTQQRYRTRHRFFGNVLGQWINWPFVTSRFEARNPGAILGGKMPKLSRSFSSEKSYSPSMLM